MSADKIQSAFSRRRETSIMRLVGASNFYIQLPFLLEAGLAAGIGALIAIATLLMQRRSERHLRDTDTLHG